MSSQIILNSSNVVANTQNSQYSYTFPSNITFIGKEIGIAALNIFYSWRNITSAYRNNTFSYTWIDGTQVDVTVPDGFYEIADLNIYFQSVMFSQGHYLIDNNNQNHFYMNLQTNPTRYAVQFNSIKLPATLPVGYSYPTGLSPAWVTYAQLPQIIINNYGFGKLLGFTGITLQPMSFPPWQEAIESAYSHISDFTPEVSPVSSVIIQCNLSCNEYSNNSNVLNTFASNAKYGSLIEITYPQILFTKMNPQSAHTMTLSFYDQNFNVLAILDNNLIIQLVIRDRAK